LLDIGSCEEDIAVMERSLVEFIFDEQEEDEGSWLSLTDGETIER
jgi:hypothetical protein